MASRVPVLPKLKADLVMERVLAEVREAQVPKKPSRKGPIVFIPLPIGVWNWFDVLGGREGRSIGTYVDEGVGRFLQEHLSLHTAPREFTGRVKAERQIVRRGICVEKGLWDALKDRAAAEGTYGASMIRAAMMHHYRYLSERQAKARKA